MKLAEIAEKIDAHLKRFEADPVINKGTRGARFFWASARPAGRYVQITYISYQNHSSLSKDDALKYLAALDGGSTERHYEALREKREQQG